MKKVEGKALDKIGEHWKVECPECGKELEYKGWFDSGDICKCYCGCKFLTTRIYFENGTYII